MKGQQTASGGEEGSLHLQEGGVTQEEDQASPSIASVQSAGTFTADPALRYIFRTDSNGGQQVTYRVIQVTDSPLDTQNEGTAAVSVLATAPGFSPTSQAVTQSVLQGSFINGESSEIDSSGSETRFAYLPSADASATAVVTTQGSDAILSQASAAAGQFYVMMSPQDVLPGSGTQRSIAPRAHPYSPKLENPRVARDDKRRAQHNEVERRRRDKINNWIVQLSKIIPDCSVDSSKTGQSKGGILSKACDYIQELRQGNVRLLEELKALEQLQVDNELLRQQAEELKNENVLLRSSLRQHSVDVAGQGSVQ
ncbi:upstream stimulatory factor 1-like isoform X1 [Stegostoma tigrinum]|uniref:upstream stimulatory factor 1-like isoform X1 n=1 Tax=Stegostoma tigrinum TaxID=3053191 RepID=UPI00286FC858|nr:upstream stimulatory factor 1-like isoform X1 [Stegostoma tigrinum]